MKLLNYCRLIAADLFFLLTRSKNSVSILMYHSVGENDAFFNVKPEDFEWQMGYLKERGFAVISLSDLLYKINKKEKFLSNTVVITFDDGYEDNYLNAFPILKKYQFPAEIFLQSGCIDSYKQNSEGIKLKILSEEQIKEMTGSGIISFGGHTVSHPKLSKLSQGEIKKEILENKTAIKKITGVEPVVFAYPFGDYNNFVKDYIKNYYKGAVSVGRGFAGLSSDVFGLPRNSIDSMVDKLRFKFKFKF